MRYQELLDKFNTRAKNRDYKTIGTGALRLRPTDGAITVHVIGGTWHQVGTKYKRIVAIETDPLFAVTPDNVMTLMLDIAPNHQQKKNLLSRISGAFVSAQTNKNRIYNVRLWFDTHHTYPVAAGLKLDLQHLKVLWAPSDIILKTNRTAAKPVYEYVNRAVKLATVLHKLGDTTLVDRWGQGRGNALTDYKGSVELTDENLADMALAAYDQGLARVSVSNYRPRTENDPQAPPNAGLWRQRQIERAPEEFRVAQHEAAINYTKRTLTHFLKNRHGAMDVTVANT